jgi:hypothetical protein
VNSITTSHVGGKQIRVTTGRQACSLVATRATAAPTVPHPNFEAEVSRELATATMAAQMKSHSDMPASSILPRQTTRVATFGASVSPGQPSYIATRRRRPMGARFMKRATGQSDAMSPGSASGRSQARGDASLKIARRSSGTIQQEVVEPLAANRIQPNHVLTRVEENQ